MSEDDQLNIGHKVLLWRRAILDLQKAEAQYGESLFLTRQSQLAREEAQKSCSNADQELRLTAAETAKKYITLCNISASPLHERAVSSWCYPLPLTCRC